MMVRVMMEEREAAAEIEAVMKQKEEATGAPLQGPSRGYSGLAFR